MTGFDRIALIGFGEVGQSLALALIARGHAELAAWDTAFADPCSGPSCALQHITVRKAVSAADAAAGAELVISAVTAERDVEAAIAVASGLHPGAYFLDVNSASPGTKRACFHVIAWTEARYVEAAVMSPINPLRLAVPMLLGGSEAAGFLAPARATGFCGGKVFSAEIGHAAAAKLCRSIIVKGLEALLAESLLAARHYGVEQKVLDSLSDLLPLPDWNSTATYMISRSLEHGARRAEELREAALTVEDAGLAPLMSRAIAARQAWAAHYGDARADDLAQMLDAINHRRAEDRP
jgi:3-hydroxyisobutyrate dehydrogenase-like beta-hydroxyacid dehydrogenase